MKLARNLAFSGLWLLVIGVSVYDGYWVLANRMTINEVERNPLGRQLLDWDGGDVRLLLAVKAAGTLLAAAVLLVLYWTWPRVAWLVCSTLASLQIALFLFLHLA